MPKEYTKAEQIAREINNWLQSACYDYAECEFPDMDIKREREADRIYNDRDALCDLVGDRIYDAARGEDQKFSKKMFSEICDALGKHGHTALKEACEMLRKDHGV